MQCFICMTYMLLICSAHPKVTGKITEDRQHPKDLQTNPELKSVGTRENLDDLRKIQDSNLAQLQKTRVEEQKSQLHKNTKLLKIDSRLEHTLGHVKESESPSPRSLFRDVIESLRIRSQLPDDDNSDNNLSQSYERFGYENEPQLPSDADFIPRRNDRIEMPTLKYRFPKSLNSNETEPEAPKQEEIVIFIDTTTEPKTTTTQKPKKQKRPKPPALKKPNKKDEETEPTVPERPEFYPTNNNMGGQSHIGNRESQLIVKPTVIVNLRGSVVHRESDIKIEGRIINDTTTGEIPYNVFNINQKIQLERTFGGMGSAGVKKTEDGKKEEVKKCSGMPDVPAENRKDRKFENVLELWFDLPYLRD